MPIIKKELCKDKIIAFRFCPFCGGKMELIGTDERDYRYQCKVCAKDVLGKKITQLLDKGSSD